MTAKELKRIREEELKMSQEELADAMGVTRSTITRWELNTKESARSIPLMAEKLLAFLRASKGVLKDRT